jgi:hypothetical protein
MPLNLIMIACKCLVNIPLDIGAALLSALRALAVYENLNQTISHCPSVVSITILSQYRENAGGEYSCIRSIFIDHPRCLMSVDERKLLPTRDARKHWPRVVRLFCRSDG